MIYDKQDYIYLLFAKSMGLIKIGKTWNIKLRMTQLMRGGPKDIQLIAYIQKPERSALSYEKEIHRKINGKRGGSEWHKFSPQIIQDFLKEKGVVICK